MSLPDLIHQFQQAIDYEISLIDKEGREQAYQLLSGERDPKSAGNLYIFFLAEGIVLPEEASGNFRFLDKDYSVFVVAQEANRVWLLLENAEGLPEQLPTVRLVLNETQLLKTLKERLAGLAFTEEFGLAPLVFGESQPRVSSALIESDLNVEGDSTLRALSQCVGSNLTFLWGPPGTGKTFTIAALVGCLVRAGETVLVTSHTHAAVEQALGALIEEPTDSRRGGPLFDSPLLEEGRILKIGPKKGNLPPIVYLETHLEEKARLREEAIALLRSELGSVTAEASTFRRRLAPWNALERALSQLKRTEENELSAEAEASELRGDRERRLEARDAAIFKIARAEKSFLIGRTGRVEVARREALVSESALESVTLNLAKADAKLLRARQSSAIARAAATQAKLATAGLEPHELLSASLANAESQFAVLNDEIKALEAAKEEDAKELVHNASALFFTLTKLYMDTGLLSDLTWDTVVVDEVSMAMLPLLVFAAARARKRIVLVGDMYQLPPVTRSEKGTPGGLLASDIFEFRGITASIDKGTSVAEVAKLTEQRRMDPMISAVSRGLIEPYRDLTDHADVTKRGALAFGTPLDDRGPLVTVDLSELTPWSGKIPGSLSRFNFVSGQVAVELAQLFARNLPKPDANSRTPVGIVTPYAAQRRYLNKLIDVLQLKEWVAAGTVHTFQGGECDVIIFDSVVSAPHWTARFTNPTAFSEIRRDLNVAVTRARRQFIFLGDIPWLNRYARPQSGFGRLLRLLTKDSTPIPVSEILEEHSRILTEVHDEPAGWTLVAAKDATLLRENEFYSRFLEDVRAAQDRVVLYTPYIGKTRWPQVSKEIELLPARGVDVLLLHKPLSDRDWRNLDVEFAKSVLEHLQSTGIKLMPVTGVHAKTIVIDSAIVYDGSLNWASQSNSYEHMWRFENKDMAVLVERMLQLAPITKVATGPAAAGVCPFCGGPLIVINQAAQSSFGAGQNDVQPVKLGCANNAADRRSCRGYIRRVDGRAPFTQPPACPLGQTMRLRRAGNGRPWAWRCNHQNCRTIRWAQGDYIPE